MGKFREWLWDLGDDSEAWKAIAQEALQRMSEDECEDMAREAFDFEDEDEDEDEDEAELDDDAQDDNGGET